MTSSVERHHGSCCSHIILVQNNYLSYLTSAGRDADDETVIYLVTVLDVTRNTDAR